MLLTRTNFALIITITLLAGCKSRIESSYVIVSKFPIDKELSGNVIPAFDESPGMYDIGSAGKYFLCTEKHKEHIFTLYSPEYEKICGFAKSGRAGNEYLAPIYTGQYSIDGDVTRFKILDRLQGRLDTWVIGEKDPTPARAGKYEIPQANAFDLRNLYRLPGNGYCGVSDEFDCRYFTSDSTFSEVVFYDNIMQFDRLQAHPIAQTASIAKPDLTRVAIAYYNFPQLDIRDIGGEIIKTVFIDRILLPEEVDFEEEDSDEYFVKLSASEDFIYALYNLEAETKGKSKVLVFTWGGEAVASYTINAADSFCVNSEQTKIVAINRNQSSAMCTEYQMQGTR